MRALLIGFFLIIFATGSAFGQTAASALPHLTRSGNTQQLIVDGKPFIVLGGELGNSSFTSVEYMAPIWPRLKKLNLNTVLAPVYWELIEPVEGQFDFALLDQLIGEARKNNLRLVLLWFGAWKNSMSSHAPGWVKTDQSRFPRVQDDLGKSQEILTPFSENNLQADLKAFQALMAHVKKTDQKHHTVIMIQPENEIGMLPVARDHSPLANARFNAPVPRELLDYLTHNRDKMVPEFQQVWAANGFRNNGTWEDIFGKGYHSDEIFMAWFYARYTEQIVAGGKAVYPLPMFVNAALNRPDREPGKGYPSAGPLPHIMDVWLAGAPSIDFLAPDFYFPNIKYWCDLFTRRDNSLFIPEHRFDNTVAAKAAFTIGHYQSIGFSPFFIESGEDEPHAIALGKMYDVLAQILPVLTAHHGQGKVEGVLLEKDKPFTDLYMGDYELNVKHSHTLGWEAGAGNADWIPGGAVIIQTGKNTFLMAGSGVVLTFKNRANPEKITGILKTEEGHFVDGAWQVIRHLNGDQTHQGRHVRIFLDDISIVRFSLYEYE
ncbi:MAG TPA: DUF5597 domain-containing protein [Calditrichia bacterium]|nr:DUF5597 domain-containing protein [Calditrichia bacterium]